MHPDAAFPHLRIEIKRTARDEYEIWRSELRAKQPRFAHENVRFDHDPLWRSRFLSIQSACDGNHPVWDATRVIFTFAQFAPMAAMMVR
jgi:hypothetical protein